MDELKELLKALRNGDKSLDELRNEIDRVLPSRPRAGLAAIPFKSGAPPGYGHETERDDRDVAVELIPNQDSNTSPDYESKNDSLKWEDAGKGAARADPTISALVDSTKIEGEILDGRYKLIRYLGLGRTSTMYKALDREKLNAETLDPYVAIKILKKHLWSEREWFLAFQKAAIEAQRLIHESIARVYALEQNYETVYLVTEYVSGETLSNKILRTGFTGMPLQDALHIVRTVGQALAFAHEQGIVHYDLYPGNVYITDNDTVKVTNFAVAQAFRRTALGVRHPRTLDATSLCYESPEALAHHSPDPRDDVYSLACMTYELLTGNHPYERKLANEARSAQIEPLKPKALSFSQWKALKSGLCLDRARRTSSATVFLQQFTTPSFNMPIWFWAVAAGILGLGLTGGVSYIFSTRNLIPMMPLEQRSAVIEERTSYSTDVTNRSASQELTRFEEKQEHQTSTATIPKPEPSDFTGGAVKAQDTQSTLSSMLSSEQTAEQTSTVATTDQPITALTEQGQAASPAGTGPDHVARQSQRINYLMATAYMQIMMKKLTLPKGDNAFESYQKVLDLHPQHEQALNGIANIKSIYIGWAATAEQRGEWEKAERYLSRALKITPSDTELIEGLRRAREEKAAFLSRQAEAAEITEPTAAGAVKNTSQALPATVPERISIENVKHELLTSGNPARARIQATISGKAIRVEVFVEMNKQVTSHEMNVSHSSAQTRHSNRSLYTREIPLPYPAERTKYVLAAYKQDGTVIYSPKGGTQTYSIEPLLQGPAVVINEFMVSNTQTLADPQGDYDDWIELYNRTPKTLDMSDYYLSDDKSDLKKWQFPPGTTIGGYGYLLVWADGEAQYTGVGHFGLELHTNFQLSKLGEYVLLVDSDANENKILDGAFYEQQPSDFSISRHPNGTGDFSVTSLPTPGTRN